MSDEPSPQEQEAVCCLVYESSWTLWHYLERFDGGSVANADAVAGEEEEAFLGPQRSAYPSWVSFYMAEDL